MRPTRFEIDIEELVLDGFPAVEEALLAVEIERALAARLSGSRGDRPSAETRAGSSLRTIGVAVAERLHESVLGRRARC